MGSYSSAAHGSVRCVPVAPLSSCTCHIMYGEAVMARRERRSVRSMVGKQPGNDPQRAEMFAGLVQIHLLMQPRPPPPSQPTPPPPPEAAPIKHSIKEVSQGAAWRSAV